MALENELLEVCLQLKALLTDPVFIERIGTASSGNWGHAGRKGIRGGSGKSSGGGGIEGLRQFAKERGYKVKELSGGGGGTK